jgi:O-antigen/teichoic acid export membrane protein
MAFLAGMWIVISQTDKLVLSWVLGLRDYGCFMVTVTLTGAIYMLVTPISQALQPRFNVLVAQCRETDLTDLYRSSTQVTSAVVFAIAGVMACFPEALLRAWTGNAEVAREAARTLPLYAFGNAVVALLGLAFLMQFAYGKVRWHVIGNCLFGAIWIPGAYVAALRRGAVGTGWVWLLGNVTFLVLWVPYVHYRILPRLWWRWLVYDVGAIVLVEGAGMALLSRIDLTTLNRYWVFAVAILTTGLLAVTGLTVGRDTRAFLISSCRRWMAKRFA